MSKSNTNTYLFFTCQPGAELPLKRELAVDRPGWRLAFSRPGLVSFKVADPPSAILTGPMPVFARTRSVSLGRVAGERLADVAMSVWQLPAVQQHLTTTGIAGLHVWQRDTEVAGDQQFEPGITPLAEEARRALIAAAEAELAPQQQAAVRSSVVPHSAVVLDVVLVEPGEWLVGWHRADGRIARWPGGLLPVVAPEDMVSRAYLKMEEALKWSALPTTPGDHWVELGCAPGGASQALLARGFHVLGVDPAEVDERVAEHPRFRHVRRRVADVRRVEFAHAKWLAADLNVAPQYTLDAVEGVVGHRSTALRGLVLTLKLANWDLAAPERLAEYVARVQSWGLRDVRLRQLAHHRHEVCLVALPSRGQRRVRRRSGRSATPRTTGPEAPDTTSPGIRFDAPLKSVPKHHWK